MAKWWKPFLLAAVTFSAAVSLKNDFLYFLLGFELMVYLAAFLEGLWAAKNVTVRVNIPEPRVTRKESFQIRAELTNTSRFPIPRLMVRLAVRIFPEKEELLLKGKLMLDGEEEGSLCFQMDGEHCACLEIRPDQLVITDCMGIFERRCRVETGRKALLFILPEGLRGDGELPETAGVFPNGDEDAEKRGNNAVDVSEIRSYRGGDSLKLVHWKLSARWNDLMVKEMTAPAEKLTWLYLNLAEPLSLPPVRRDPAAWDHFVKTAAAASAMLLKMEKRHIVLWLDASCGTVVRCPVADEMSLQDMLCRLLRTDSFPAKEDAPLPKEIYLDETKGTCIEIDLQGNFVCRKTP